MAILEEQNARSEKMISTEASLEHDERWLLVQRIVASSQFAKAPQLQKILIYVTRRALLEDGVAIPEHEIACRVLGRRENFNPNDDNIVRVQAGHLRKKLDMYFSGEGNDELLLLVIPKGAYVPSFMPRPDPGILAQKIIAEPPDSMAPAKPAILAAAVPNRSISKVLVLAVVACIVLGAVCIYLVFEERAIKRSFYAWQSNPTVASFWAQFLDAAPDTDVILADTSFSLVQIISRKTFHFSDYHSRSYISELQREDLSSDTRAAINSVLYENLGTPSVFKLAQRISALDPLGKRIHQFSAREYMPALVKRDNVIIIGSRNANPWAELFDSRLNFDVKFVDNVTSITNRAPTKSEKPTYTPSSSAGYSLVAYLPNPDGAGKVLLIESTDQEGAEAAGDFLFSENKLAEFQKELKVSKLPYFELLLRTSRVKGTPLTAVIEAYRTYPNLH